MTKEYWLKRKAGWEIFHKWEEEQRWSEYSAMSFREKVKILHRLLETAKRRNPDYFRAPADMEEWLSRGDVQFRLDFVRKKKRLSHG